MFLPLSPHGPRQLSFLFGLGGKAVWPVLRWLLRLRPLTREEAISRAIRLMRTGGRRVAEWDGAEPTSSGAVYSVKGCVQHPDGEWWLVYFTHPKWRGCLPDYMVVEVSVRYGRARIPLSF